MDKSEAARLLSMEEDEIFDVKSGSGGTAVRTLDGNVMLITEGDDGKHDVALLVKPRPTFNGFAVAFPDLDEAQALARVGVEDLGDPRPRPADPDIPEGSPEDAFATPGEAAATAATLARTATGGEVSTTPEDAPGPEHAEAVEETHEAQIGEREDTVVEEAATKAEKTTKKARG